MKVTIKGFVHQCMYTKEFRVYCSQIPSDYLVVVGPAEFEFDVPDTFNPVAAQVSALNAKLDKLAESYHSEVKQIKGRINDLLCLEAPDENAEAADFLGARA